MKQTLKHYTKTSKLLQPAYSWISARRRSAELHRWELAGRPSPPPHLAKQAVLERHAEKYGLRIFVETGTYYGDMVDAMKDRFDQLYSIELSGELYQAAVRRFNKSRNVEIIHGDSGVELGKLLPRIGQPTLFWLDGHYSAGVTATTGTDTPICEELQHIFSAKDLGHVIIIDDARMFGADPAYPSMEALCRFVKENRSTSAIEVDTDSIRIVPGR